MMSTMVMNYHLRRARLYQLTVRGYVEAAAGYALPPPLPQF
jgi:hypothetical protein